MKFTLKSLEEKIMEEVHESTFIDPGYDKQIEELHRKFIEMFLEWVFLRQGFLVDNDDLDWFKRDDAKQSKILLVFSMCINIYMHFINSSPVLHCEVNIHTISSSVVIHCLHVLVASTVNLKIQNGFCAMIARRLFLLCL